MEVIQLLKGYHLFTKVQIEIFLVLINEKNLINDTNNLNVHTVLNR